MEEDRIPEGRRLHIEETRKKHRTVKKKRLPAAGRVMLTGFLFGLSAAASFYGVRFFAERIPLRTDQKEAWPGLTEPVSRDSFSGIGGENGLLLSAAQDEASEPVIGSTGKDVGPVAAVAQNAMPCVVAITTVSIQEIPSFFGYYQNYSSTGTGSGIIVGENDEELLIATNYHVVEGAATLNVCFIGDDVVSAERQISKAVRGEGGLDINGAVPAVIKGADEQNDLAVIAVARDDIPQQTRDQIKIARLGDSDALVVGEQVVAIGNALGYGQTVTSGWISALDRTVSGTDGTYSRLIQTDAAINPGNSGGALLNMNGEVIGINSAKYASSKVEGTGYAIPVSVAEPILQELIERASREKITDPEKAAWLGVELMDLSDEVKWMYDMPDGAFVSGVYQGSPAEAGGVYQNDIIMRLDGQKISGKAELIDKLAYYQAGEEIELTLARNTTGRYREVTLLITLQSRPEQ